MLADGRPSDAFHEDPHLRVGKAKSLAKAVRRGPRARERFAERSNRCNLPLRVLKGSLHLVSCPRNNMAFAAGQLAVFQGASDERILIDT
jgi:hypothetical protein